MRIGGFCLILILQAGIVVGQKLDTTLSFLSLPPHLPKQINYTDVVNKKQGFWIDYKVHEYSDTDKLGGIHQYKSVGLYSYGTYRNNKKSGKWEYIDQSDGDAVYPVKTEEYFPDGSLKVYSHLTGFAKFYNPNRTRIVNIIQGDTITVTRIGSKKEGYGKIIFAKHVLKKFDPKDFELEELNVENYVYARDIKRFKAKFNLQ